jgi:hypothetical protein
MKRLKNFFVLSISIVTVLIILENFLSPNILFPAKVKVKGGKESSEKAVDEVIQHRKEMDRLVEIEHQKRENAIKAAAKFSRYCENLNLDYESLYACQGKCGGIQRSDDAFNACVGNCGLLDYSFSKVCEGNCSYLKDYNAIRGCESCGGGQSWMSLYLLGNIISCN